MWRNKAIARPPSRKNRAVGLRKEIPIGPGFQAGIPALTGPRNYRSLDTSRWLGTKIWPLENNETNMDDDDDDIGKGRANTCDCHHPGSSQCRKKHIDEEKNKLRNELGTAFRDSGLDQMGEAASAGWTIFEKRDINFFVKNYDKPKMNKSFLKMALDSDSIDKSRESIICYYYNILVPRRMASKFRPGQSGMEVSTDDDEEETGSSSRKRSADELQLNRRRYLAGAGLRDED